MKKSIVILFAATIGLAACNNYKKAEGGLEYKVFTDAGKEKIKEGDIVELNFVQKNQGDTVIFSTYDIESPQVFPVAKKMYGGDMNDVLTLFGEGDSATFKLNLDTMAKHTGQPKQGPNAKDTYMVFNIKVEKVFKKNAGENDQAFQKRAQEFFQKEYLARQEKVKGAEAGKIKSFIEDNKLKTQTTASGLQYVISNPGSAQKPVLGDTVMLKYTGKLAKKSTEGTYYIFDTTDKKTAEDAKIYNAMVKYEPRPFSIGNAIPGFDEAYQLIGKGGKITAIIPSKLGYGEGGQPQAKIGPFTPIVFDIEIVDIKKPVGGAPVAATPPVSIR
jgi:FKBP-type peptidyl-prolyl cis-trans isomerase FkpA